MSSQHTAGTRPSWVDADLFPFESHFVELGGHVVHYVDEGSGPILLMLHGNPTWSFVYRDVIRSLRDQFRCVALDYPGFGLSVAAPGYRYQPADHAGVVVEFLDRMDLSDVTLVAHDWGGPIGLFTAERRSNRFQRIVLANTWAWPTNGELRAEIASRVMGGPIGRELIRRFNLFVNALIPAGHRRRKVSQTEMNHYREALDTWERRNACAILPGAITGSREFLAGIEGNLQLLDNLPTLIVWADRDVAFSDKDRERLEEKFPDHTTVVVKGAGHFVQSDAADEMSEAIRSWWSGSVADKAPDRGADR
ncbi:haloalkane dehalogenase 2 [Lentzea sp. NBRC 105346]|uniref:alpha/beta fold hydrolase n=1 Tax=Lentzea sp. NBRC 105346 TaxID=3032205 RepID=UPI0024A56A1D|nr:alpha/beta fold hydrolase [Lentzea sp. NBRC 105346]GLZ28061.1 haloalkane dehalogenase 2 [Lentzea sp. NBRC 105346]